MTLSLWPKGCKEGKSRILINIEIKVSGKWRQRLWKTAMLERQRRGFIKRYATCANKTGIMSAALFLRKMKIGQNC
jgi:hypothetical protein